MPLDVVWGNEPPYQPLIEPRFELLRCFVTANTPERATAEPSILLLMTAEDARRQTIEFIEFGWIDITTRPKDRLRCTTIGIAELQAYDGRREQHRIEQMNRDRAANFRLKQKQARELGGMVGYRHVKDGYVCDVCREYSKHTYLPDEAPPLPHADCTSELGECRCFAYVHIGDE